MGGEPQQLRWPKTIKEVFTGMGYGDPQGNPRTCREALCGTTTQVLLFQLWFSFVFDCISVFLLFKAPTATDDIYVRTYYDILYFGFQILVMAWTIAVVLRKYYVQLYIVFIVWILITACDTGSLILPIVVRRFVKHGDFVSYTVNQSLNVLNDLFIILLLLAYLLQECKNRRTNGEREVLIPKTEEKEKEKERSEKDGVVVTIGEPTNDHVVSIN